MINPILIGILLSAVTWSGFACQQNDGKSSPTITFPAKASSELPEEDYVFQLLQLVLEKSTDKFGPCKAELTDFKAPIKRMLKYLEDGNEIDVIALTVSKERDNQFLSIKVPIAKGLVGYRLLMINQAKVEQFSKINSLEQLKRQIAGQGVDWPDVKILRQNGLPVVTSGNIKTLINMLAHQRFDYFPQGALQIGRVLDSSDNDMVTVAENVLISYPSITVFYVNKSDHTLANRLKFGLEQAFADGSFSRFFDQHPITVNAKKHLQLNKKDILFLCNQNLPAWVPLSIDRYWLKPWPSHIKQCSMLLRS